MDIHKSGNKLTKLLKYRKKETKRHTTEYKILHRKLKIERQETCQTNLLLPHDQVLAYRNHNVYSEIN